MANPTFAKQVAIARDMLSNLKDRLSGDLSASDLPSDISFDTTTDYEGMPIFRVGSAAAGSAGALIRVMPIDQPLAKDILGLDQESFVPSVIQVGFEANGTGMDVNDLDTYASILGECMWRGCRVEVYESSNGDNPDAADLGDATKLKYTWDGIPGVMIANQ